MSIADLDLLRGHLDTLQIANVAQWDVLAFITTHGTNLASVDHITRLLGYDRTIVSAALDSLSSSGLIRRSRGSRGLRLFQLAVDPEDDSLWFSLNELMKAVSERKGRLLLTGYLARRVPRKDRRERRGLHLA
jgi:DNA-binding MarR family transcriptional regulator